MTNSFVSNFITKCVRSGINTPSNICLVAEKELNKIEETINKIEPLRTVQSNLRKVLRQIGGNRYKRCRKSIPSIEDFSIPIKDLQDNTRQMCDKICDFLSKQNAGVSARNIMDNVANKEKNTEVYSAIQRLEEHGILKRFEKSFDKTIHKGDCWADRAGLKEADEQKVEQGRSSEND